MHWIDGKWTSFKKEERKLCSFKKEILLPLTQLIAFP